MLGEVGFDFTSYLVVAALIPFATSYGLFFAGYETVYEGSNLMTLQLAYALLKAPKETDKPYGPHQIDLF